MTAAIGFAALAGAGCQSPEPYVYGYREFDRSAPNFRREPPERSWVTVCAPLFRAPDATIAALAEQTCQKHGKSAVEADRQFGVCPILLPSAIIYRCASPAPEGQAAAPAVEKPLLRPAPAPAFDAPQT